MTTLAKLFGRSPFGPLQRHMEQVAKCVTEVGASLQAFDRGDWDALETHVQQVSQLEHEADQIKDDIRTHMREKFFMAVDRNRLLDVLSVQDGLADTAEDVCVLLTYKQLKTPQEIKETFLTFRDLNIEAFLMAECIIRELDELVETGFGGTEAEKVRKMVHDVSVLEHRADIVQRDLLKAIYSIEDQLTHGEFHLWMRLTSELANLSNRSENLANRVLAMLELK